jgi:hypothetical protein
MFPEIGSKEDKHLHLMERMDSPCHARRMVGLVRLPSTQLLMNIQIAHTQPDRSRSMISFVVSILSFVWRTGSTSDPSSRSPLTPQSALAPRIAITCVFALGMVYLGLIVTTLRRYGKVSGKGERRSGFGVPPSGVGGAPAGGVTSGLGLGLGLALGPERTEERRGRQGLDERRRDVGMGRREEEESRNEKERNGVLRSALGLGLTNLGDRGAQNGLGEELLVIDLEKGEGAAFSSGEESGTGYNSSTPQGK